MAKINVRSKGQRGEREVINMLQEIIDRVCRSRVAESSEMSSGEGENRPDHRHLLRNQLQSAIGGSDICGLEWLAIEVKYQETENINSWWAQTLSQTKPNQIAVLIHRANGKKWKIRMMGKIELKDGRHVKCPVDIILSSFLLWFEHEFRSRG